MDLRRSPLESGFEHLYGAGNSGWRAREAESHMESVAVFRTVKPGMYDKIRAFQEDVIQGNSADANLAHWAEVGLKTVKLFHQTEPTEGIIIYLEAADMAHVFDEDEHGQKATDVQWSAFMEDVSLEHVRAVSDILIDWHHEDGHKQTP